MIITLKKKRTHKSKLLDLCSPTSALFFFWAFWPTARSSHLSRRSPRSDWPPPHRRCRWPRRSGRPSSSWWRSAACRTFSAAQRRCSLTTVNSVPVIRGDSTKFQWGGVGEWFFGIFLSWLGFVVGIPDLLELRDKETIWIGLWYPKMRRLAPIHGNSNRENNCSPWELGQVVPFWMKKKYRGS